MSQELELTFECDMCRERAPIKEINTILVKNHDDPNHQAFVYCVPCQTIIVDTFNAVLRGFRIEGT